MTRKESEKKKDEMDLNLSDMQSRMKDHLISKKPLFGDQSPFSEMLQTMVNQILDAEAEEFLDEQSKQGKKNKKNGRGSKTITTSLGKVDINPPRDRNGDFEPELVAKRQRELSSGMDEQILALYAQGNSIEDVRRLLARLYNIDISAGKISAITDKILPEITEWQNRVLKESYPVIYLDAIHFKTRHDGKYESRAFYTIYSINWEGERDLLGMYMDSSEKASNWARILGDLQRRGVKDVLLMCTDNLTGFSEAIEHVFPNSIVQKCIVHQVRNSLNLVDSKDRKGVIKGLQSIYKSATRDQALTALRAFELKWPKYQYIVGQWEANWDELMAFMDFPIGLQKMVYTTNPVEALHRIMRKIIKGKGAWVSQQALMKQIYLSLMYNTKSWKKSVKGWPSIKLSLMETYGERFKQFIHD